MTTVTEPSANVPCYLRRSTSNGRNGKLRVICRYGGSIVSHRYVGGDTRIVAVPPAAETSFAALASHIASALGVSYDFKLKYQLPDHRELDSLISVATDEDVQIMLEEHGYLTCEASSAPKTRIRLFLFPTNTEGGLGGGGASRGGLVADGDWLGVGESNSKPEMTHPVADTWFVDALKGAEMMVCGRDSTGSNGQEVMMHETSSNLGSTSSSSASSSNLPPVRRSGEGIISVKSAPVESLTREEEASPLIAFSSSAVTQISSHELPTRPHVLENKNMYEAELNKPVPVQVPVSGYPPYLNQAQQQHTHVVYSGQPYITGTSSPMALPATTYHQHQTNHVQYQHPPQPYPIYYNPVDQYSSRHVQAPPVKHNNNVFNSHQVDSYTSSALAPGLSSHVYPPPHKPVLNTHQVDIPVVRTSKIPPPELSSHVYPPQPKPVLNTHQVGYPLVRTSSPLAPELYPPPKPVDSSVQTSSEAACRDDLNYDNDFDDDTVCAQIYKTQPPAPIVPSQFQNMMLNKALGQLRTHNG